MFAATQKSDAEDMMLEAAWSVPVGTSETLARIARRGYLTAGVSKGVRGLSQRTARGEYEGFDVDIARGVAAVILGRADAVRFTPLGSGDRFTAIVSGAIDLGVYNASCSLSRELAGVVFPAIALYDGESALVRGDSGLETLSGFAKPTIAIVAQTTTAANLAAYFGDRPHALREYPTLEAATVAYRAGEADAVVFDATGLAGVRADLPDPDAHRILAERLSKEPMGPVTSASDPVFSRVVAWTFRALMLAEELGIDADRLDAAAPGSPAEAFLRRGLPIASDDPLAPARLEALLSAVGTYGDVFERNLGAHSDLALPRGPNRIWTEGGLLYAPPIG